MFSLRKPFLKIGVLGIATLVFLGLSACGGSDTKSGDAMSKSGDAMMEKTGDAMTVKLPNQLFAAHYVDSYPKHGDVFAQVPDRALIDFNFTLSEISTITVTRDNVAVQTSPVSLGERKLSMWVTLPATAGDGLYLAKYKACWPDKSCHDGQFAFTVDGKTKSSYMDMTGQKEVRLTMQNVKFNAANIIVSKGTKVTWTNQDNLTHFVNTNPHPSHNVLPKLNSLELKLGDTFSYTFDQAGEWGYHCSAHEPQGMYGRVIVQ